MLDQFKSYTKDRLDVEQLVTLSAFGKALKAEFEAQRVEVPEYVTDQLKSIGREIQARVADGREALRKKLRAQLDTLKTTSERREDLQKQLAALEEPVSA
jgi:hypothetical protein